MYASSEEKRNDSKDSFCEELEKGFDHFSKYRDVMQRWGERIFSNRQFGMRVCIRLEMIMVLE